MPLILHLTLAVAMAVGQPQDLPDRRPIGKIEFFGYKGLDVERVRASLPLHEGDLFPPESLRPSDDPSQTILERIQQTIGRGATGVNFTCCDERQRWIIYIGLPGGSSREVAFHPAPRGDARFPLDFLMSGDEFSQAWEHAVLSGNAAEERSQGFAISADPVLGAAQMELHGYALRHEAEILTVLETSAAAEHRALAAQALGYAQPSHRQVAALARACFDADGAVRNNAARALGVLAGVNPALLRRIPPATFMPLVTSTEWTDRNKGIVLIEAMTRSRDPRVLAAVRDAALDSLIEMAKWRTAGHAYQARVVLGRLGGIDEKRLQELAQQGSIDEIISAASAH